MNPYADFHDWLVIGTRWTLCRVVSQARGLARVILYDGREAQGKPRRGLFDNWIVEAIGK